MDNLSVQLHQVLVRIDHIRLFICDHKTVISQRLDFQIIIEVNQTGNLLVRRVAQEGLEELSCLTGAADDQSLPVCLKNCFRYPGSFVKVH